MAKYRAYARTFIAPHLIEEGTTFTISDDFEPGPHLEPLDEAAEAAWAKYQLKRPHASLEPIEQLSNTITSIEEAEKSEEPTLSLAESLGAKAQPGLTEGGKATPVPK